EYVHAMRVAVRRMRSAGLLFGGFFQRSAVRTYLKELRKLTRQLGAVRDLDVLERHRASFVHHQGQFMGGKGLARQWRNSRKGHHAALLTWLDSEEYSQFVASFADFCQSPGVGTAPNEKAGALLEPTQVRHVLPGMIVARFERVRAYEALFDTGADVSIDHLHGLRIECKHLRYLLEFFRHLLGEEGALLIAQLKKLQDHLGDLNDAAVRQERVTLASGKVAKAFKSEPDATVDRLRQTFPEVFRTFVGVENREALARAMARL
ncbi:MAG: CHAD domain-containing protein, partial [Caldilineaceae bacterium]|nr:CHAD domain-containing protein [Caldilineaceae bacterium]